MKTFDEPFARLAPRAAHRTLLRTRYQLVQRGALWVFAYGSLLWRPCYQPEQTRPATLANFRRSLCVWTLEARGTPAQPGLGLGLEPHAGARCAGAVHRVPRAQWHAALRELWAREMWTGIYVPRWLTVASPAGPVSALTFVVNTRHPQYAPGLSISAAAQYVRDAHGKLGSCLDYVRDTERSLRKAHISDPGLTAVLARLASPPPGDEPD